MIEVQNLTKYYGRKAAIRNVSFFVNKGEILGFLGPNAAGKTTTMRIITCYMPATEGTAKVGGFDVFENPVEVRKKIGYLPENPPLYTDMSVEAYLRFVGKIKGIDGSELSKKIDRVTEVTNIDNVRRDLIAKLSKGYRQRVALAQALIHDPEVLILDEPTIGLDPKQIIEVRELIKSLSDAHTVILSTHILPEVSMTCERVVIIDKGRVVAEDTPENLTSKLKGSELLHVEVEGPAGEVKESIEKLKGVTRVRLSEGARQGRAVYNVESKLGYDVRKELARAVVENNWGLLELRPVGMSLEEIFLHLTTEEKV